MTTPDRNIQHVTVRRRSAAIGIVTVAMALGAPIAIIAGDQIASRTPPSFGFWLTAEAVGVVMSAPAVVLSALIVGTPAALVIDRLGRRVRRRAAYAGLQSGAAALIAVLVAVVIGSVSGDVGSALACWGLVVFAAAIAMVTWYRLATGTADQGRSASIDSSTASSGSGRA